MIPTETDLNMPPLQSDLPEKVLPLAAVQSSSAGGMSCQDSMLF